MSTTLEGAKIIWAAPLVALVADLRTRARILREELGADDESAEMIDSHAERIEEAILKGAEVEWIDPKAAAEFLGIGEEGVRARCRRTWAGKGLARRRGTKWEISPAALQT